MRRIEGSKSPALVMEGGRKPVRVLLGSGGIATEERRELYRSLVSDHFSGRSQIVFVPFASHDHSGYTSRMQEFLGGMGQEFLGLHESSEPNEAISQAEALYVGGGNSFLLIRELHERGLIEPIREAIFSGTPYLGVSAGANVACPTMMTTNDMPIAHPESFDSLGIVPFQINPHYHPGKIKFLDGGILSDHYGETRDQRIAEFHQTFATPVLGMWEGSFVDWDGETGLLKGRATIFRPSAEPVDISEGALFDGSLSKISV